MAGKDVNPLATYRPVKPFYPVQRSALEKGWRKFAFAYLLEQGLGKTKIILDNTVILFDLNAVNGLLLLAPNEVHEQWVLEQLPEHWPRRIKPRTVVWNGNNKASHRRAAELATKPIKGQFPILAMNHEAMTSDLGYRIAKEFLIRYGKVLMAVDESHRMKTPSAMRTRRILLLGPYARVRRIATGTPSTQTPFDLYTQFNFLDPRILNCKSFLVFKHRYGIFSKEFVRNPKTGKLVEYEQLVAHQRLEELQRLIAPYSFRATKAECLKLPPKIYVTKPVRLSPAQKALYNQIREEGFALLDEHKRLGRLREKELPELPEELAALVAKAKDRVSFKIKLTMMLRLQQVIGGFITDDAKNTKAIDKLCPRMEEVLDLVEQCQGKFIIWAIYTAEILALTKLLKAAKVEVSPFHGKMTKAQRSEANDRFRDPKSSLRGLVAHVKSGGIGRNWVVAQTMIYYSLGYSVADRLQSEDRSHRIGMTGALTIFDLNATQVPIDSTIRRAIKESVDLAEQVLGASDEAFKRMV